MKIENFDNLQFQLRYLTSGYIFLFILGISLLLIDPKIFLELFTPSLSSEALIILISGYPLGYVFYEMGNLGYGITLGGGVYKQKVFEWYKDYLNKKDDRNYSLFKVIAKHDIELFKEKNDRFRERIFFLSARIYSGASVILAVIISQTLLFMHYSYKLICNENYLIFLIFCLIFTIIEIITVLVNHNKLLSMEEEFASRRK